MLYYECIGSLYIERPMKIEFTSSTSLPSYGRYKCTDCGSEFYGGGVEMHEPDCPTKKRFADLTLIVGPKTVVNAKEWFDKEGDSLVPLLPVTYTQIKEALTPEQIASVIS
jgi:hypothetical protein